MMRHAVVLGCDRWHIDFSGCYGNDWIETPAIQKLAADGIAFDQAFAASPDVAWSVQSWWSACRAGGGTSRALPSPLEQLRNAGVRTVLFVEESEERIAEPAPPFDEVYHVRGIDDLETKETETPFAQMVFRVERWLKENVNTDKPTLIFIRSRGIPVPWLPPAGFGDLYLDDYGLQPSDANGSNEPASSVGQKVELLPDYDYTEDELFDFAEEQDLAPEQARVPEETRYALALYASYASMLDRWIGRLRREVAKSQLGEQLLFLMTASTGQLFFPSELAGNRAAEDLDETPLIQGEVIQVPLIVAFPKSDRTYSEHCGTRRSGLVQSIDLFPTLCDWFGASASLDWHGTSWLPLVSQAKEQVHSEIVIASPDGSRALRTLDELYIEHPATSVETEPIVRLHEKPVDRWDTNNLASQFLPVVDEVGSRLRQLTAPSADADSSV